MTDNNDGETMRNGSSASPQPQWTQVSQRHYDPAEMGELTMAIVYAIAAARGVDPTEVLSPPLYDAVDVPAIEQAFFGSRATDKPGTDPGSLEFRYEEFLVEVKGDGWITVSEQVGPGRSVDDEPVGSR